MVNKEKPPNIQQRFSGESYSKYTQMRYNRCTRQSNHFVATSSMVGFRSGQVQERDEQVSGADLTEASADYTQSDELVSLIDAARHGDSAALSNIYERFCDRIYRYALFNLGDSQQAEDLCAQVFLKMMESVSRFEWRSGGNDGQVNPASFSSWLYRIAHNLITDQQRREARRPAVPLDSVAHYLPDSKDPAHAAEETLFHEQLAQALEGLTDLQAQVIALKFSSGLSNAEVGQMLGRSEGAVKSLQYSALQKLHRLLGPNIETLAVKNHG
jgi:RNA polymerase sigma-70 factor, ECF subfamily